MQTIGRAISLNTLYTCSYSSSSRTEVHSLKTMKKCFPLNFMYTSRANHTKHKVINPQNTYMYINYITFDLGMWIFDITKFLARDGARH